MPIYIQLLTLTPEGQERVYKDPDSVIEIQNSIHVEGVQLLGQYAVLGEYDYINLVDAEDNEAIARFSLHLGVKLGAHITTLPTIPISRFDMHGENDVPALEAGAEVPVEGVW